MARRSMLPIDDGVSPIDCILYLRISKDDELKGIGVENQESRCRYTLPPRWRVALVITDNDTSATSELPRDGYERALGLLKAGEYPAIMAMTQDRLTRKVEEASALLKLVDSHGVRIATSPTGELPLAKGNVRARKEFLNSTVDARQEVEQIAFRVGVHCEGRALRGEAHGRVPFGYRRNPELDELGNIKLNHRGRVASKTDVIYEPEAAVIRHAVKEILAGRSMRDLTREIELGDVRPSKPRINAKGIKVGGGSWSTRRVRAMVLTASYAGLREYNGEILTHDREGREITTTWPAIITPAEHYQLVELFANPNRIGHQYVGRSPKYLLSGIAECGRCGPGSKIGAQHDARTDRNATPVYRCVVTNSQQPGCHGAVNLAEAEAYVELAAKGQAARQKAALTEPAADVADQVKALYSRLDRVRGDLTKINTDVEIGWDEKKETQAAYRQEIKATEAKISALLPKAGQHLELDWETATVPGKRTALQQMVKSIKLHPGHGVKIGRKRGFTPDQVEIEWR